MANGSRYFRKTAIAARRGIFEEFSVVLPMILFQLLYGRNMETQIYIYLRINIFRWFYAGNFRNGNLRLYTVLVQREVFRVDLP
jgi:hypothetical protein